MIRIIFYELLYLLLEKARFPFIFPPLRTRKD